jgi:hypothetical protein
MWAGEQAHVGAVGGGGSACRGEEGLPLGGRTKSERRIQVSVRFRFAEVHRGRVDSWVTVR